MLDEKQFGEKKLRERNLHGTSESQLVDERVTIGLMGTSFFIESRHRLVYCISPYFFKIGLIIWFFNIKLHSKIAIIIYVIIKVILISSFKKKNIEL